MTLPPGHVDLAGDRRGDEGGAEFLEVVDGLADFGDEGVDLGCLAPQVACDCLLFRKYGSRHDDLLVLGWIEVGLVHTQECHTPGHPKHTAGVEQIVEPLRLHALTRRQPHEVRCEGNVITLIASKHTDLSYKLTTVGAIEQEVAKLKHHGPVNTADASVIGQFDLALLNVRHGQNPDITASPQVLRYSIVASA